LTLLVCIPIGLHDLYAKERWYFGGMPCYLIAFIENTLGVSSILSIFFITLERYLVIVKPLMTTRVTMMQSKTLKLIIFIWFLAITINVPLIYLSEYKMSSFFDDTEDYQCLLMVTNTASSVYIVSASFLIYVFIGVMLVYMYCRISVQLNKSTLYIFTFSPEFYSFKHNSSFDEPANSNHNCKQRSSMRTSEGELILLRKNTLCTSLHHFKGSNNSLLKYIRLRRKLICMLIAVVVAFYVCLFPVKVWNLVYMFFGHRADFMSVVTLKVYWVVNIIVRSLFYINSSINPLLYNWLSAKFRSNFKKIIYRTT